MSEYIGSFTVSVVCVIVLSFILRALMPRSSLEKYVNFVIGIIVAITLVGAFTSVGGIDFDSIIAADKYDSFSKENAYELYNEKMTEKVKVNIAAQVYEIVDENTGLESETDVMLDMDTDGRIAGIAGIYVKIYGMFDERSICDAIAQQLEINADIIHAGGVYGD